MEDQSDRNPPKVWIVIPAFNEGKAIAGVLSRVLRTGHNVVVVDDGSRDETAALARLAGATVLTHPVNLGQGAALQTGLDYALREHAEFVVTFDADGQHRPEDVDGMIAALCERQAHYALGSRFLGSATAMPASRRLLLRAAALFTRLTTGLRVTDAHNGLRAMTARGARRIRLRQNRMAHASEILDQIAASGLSYVEVPTHVDYTAYSLAKGQSSANSLNILIDLFMRRLYS